MVRTSCPEPEIRIVAPARAEPARRYSIRTPSAEPVKPLVGDTEAR
jgi:hypothetical protein